MPVLYYYLEDEEIDLVEDEPEEDENLEGTIMVLVLTAEDLLMDNVDHRNRIEDLGPPIEINDMAEIIGDINPMWFPVDDIGGIPDFLHLGVGEDNHFTENNIWIQRALFITVFVLILAAWYGYRP